MVNDKTSFMLTLFILTVLVLASNVQAVFLGITDMSDTVMLGETTDFNMFIDIEQDEIIPLKEINITMVGEYGLNKECTFYPNGTKTSFCPFLDVEPVYNSGTSEGDRFGFDHILGTGQSYGYGYGYGYGPEQKDELKYKVTLNTSKGIWFTVGDYSFTMGTAANNFSEGGDYEHVYQSDPVPIELLNPCEHIIVLGIGIDADTLTDFMLKFFMRIDLNHDCVIGEDEYPWYP